MATGSYLRQKLIEAQDGIRHNLIFLVALPVFILACEPSYLDGVQDSVRADYKPNVIKRREACAILKAVDYKYGALDEQIPRQELRPAAWMDLNQGENLRFNCERYWAHPADDVVRTHFDDAAYQFLINSCVVWLSMEPEPPSWEAFMTALRPEYADEWPAGERARLRKQGVGFSQTSAIYFKFDKSEPRIASFCVEAQGL